RLMVITNLSAGDCTSGPTLATARISRAASIRCLADASSSLRILPSTSGVSVNIFCARSLAVAPLRTRRSRSRLMASINASSLPRRSQSLSASRCFFLMSFSEANPSAKRAISVRNSVFVMSVCARSEGACWVLSCACRRATSRLSRAISFWSLSICVGSRLDLLAIPTRKLSSHHLDNSTDPGRIFMTEKARSRRIERNELSSEKEEEKSLEQLLAELRVAQRNDLDWDRLAAHRVGRQRRD